VTDADLVLGYLDAKSFLGGEMALSREAAKLAVAKIADRLGLSIERTAAGILEVVNSEMATAVRTHAAEQGLDYRRYVIVASGGAGPVHVYELARLLGIRTIVCPFGAGTNSALGFLLAPTAVDLARSHYSKLSAIDWEMLAALYRDMEEEGRATLRAAGAENVRYERTVEMRYVGQGFEISVEVPDTFLVERDTRSLQAAFDRTYTDLYGATLANVPVEALTWRLRAVDAAPSARDGLANSTRPGNPLRGRRRAYFPETGAFVDAPIYDRYALASGSVIEGPALIEERETTLVVGPGGMVRVAPSLDLVIELGEPRGGDD
jgi:N-methylhydantoinase A